MDPLAFQRSFDAALARDDLGAAAAMLDEHCDALLPTGGALFGRCVEAIPPRLQAFHPRLMLALAWRLIAQWRFAQVNDLLAATRLRLAEMTRTKDADEVARLRHALRHREMMLSLLRDEMPRAEELCRELIRESYRSDAYVSGSLFTSLLHARREQFKLSDVDLLDTQAIDYLGSERNPSALYVHRSVMGLSHLALGRTEEAARCLSDALETTSRFEPGNGSGPLSAMTGLPLSEVVYERGDFAQARTLVDRHLPHGREMGTVDQLISGYVTSARLHCRAGDYRAAFAVLDEAKLFAARRDFRRLSAWILAERFAILLRQGRLGREREHSRALRKTMLQHHLPGRSITTVMEAEALAWARLAEAHCRFDDGLALAVAWGRRAHREGAVRSRIRWNLVAARFLLLAGERRKAARLLQDTLVQAANGQFLASFLDEPAIMEFLRGRQHEEADALDPETADFVRGLLDLEAGCAPRLAAVAPEEGPASFGSLSPREIDVLTLAAAAWRRSDIAERLGLTEGTVKWYLQQIYQKLGVGKRAHAVDKARRFGLIPPGA